MNAACFVITLDPNASSTQALISRLNECGMPVFLIQGVDGRCAIPALEAEECLDYKAMHWRHLNELTSSEIGCYLAHYRTIKKAYQDGYEKICVLEDDVLLEDDFRSVLDEIFQLPEEFEMIRLMALKIRKRKIVQSFSHSKYKLVRPERGWCGAQGYVLNRKGMSKILSSGSRLYEPIDKFFDHFWEHDLQLYGVEPHIIWEAASDSNIYKSAGKQIDVSLMVKLFYHVGKGWRSLQRHFYLKLHYSQFYPTEFPRGKTGQTERIKQSI